ncbi:MAG: enoyl-CoA hydratase/isomerase family protein [Beijerinckiaceae bacterium]
MQDQANQPEALISRQGAAGVIMLNRPRQLNALTLGMVRAVSAAVEAWRSDASVTRVIMAGAGGRAFCAGGDIRALHDLGRAGRIDEQRMFWREEYILNHALKTYPKPIVALIDGIVMGGGVGLAFHGSHRVATEKLTFAMPEVGIGFFPDVGASWFLPRIEGNAGRYLALTGARIGQGDALALGLATHGVASDAIPAIIETLAAGGDIEAALRSRSVAPTMPTLAEHGMIIREAFSEDALPAIMARLGQFALGGSAFAADTLEAMRTKSPMSMAIALEQMRRGVDMGFADVMRMEYRIVSRIAAGHDFYEGVRSVIIDKDNAPAWRPTVVEKLDEHAVAAHFAPLPDDLEFSSSLKPG